MQPGNVVNQIVSGGDNDNNVFEQVGGFVGLVSDNTDIRDSYATGSVIGGNTSRIGGFAGRLTSANSRINNSYAIGTVTSSGAERGGFAGGTVSGTVRDSYWNTETSGLSNSIAGIGRTTQQLQEPMAANGIYMNWSPGQLGFRQRQSIPHAQICAICQSQYASRL